MKQVRMNRMFRSYILEASLLLFLVGLFSPTTYAQADFKTNPLLTVVTSEVVIHKASHEVWKMLYESYGSVSLFHPKLESSLGIDINSRGGVGTQRQCNISSKKFIKESIIDVVKGKSFTIEMDEAKGVPFEQAYADYQLISMSSNRTKVVQTSYFRTKPAMIGKMMKGKMSKDLAGVIIGLKYYLETGGHVDKANYRKISRVYKKMATNEKFTNQVNS